MGTWELGEPALRGRRCAAAVLLGVVCLGSLADSLLGGRLVASPVATLGTVAAGFLVGAWWSPAVAAVLVGAGSVALTAANQRADPGRYTPADDLVFFVVLLGGCVLAGSVLDARRRQVHRLRDLSADLARQEADASRAVAAEERRRLLVDVAAALLGRVDELGRLADGATLGAPVRTYARVESIARSNLEELRRVLGALGEPGGGDDRPAPADRPAAAQGRIGQLDVLVALAGLPVAVEMVAVGVAAGRSRPGSSGSGRCAACSACRCWCAAGARSSRSSA